jgi:hypothetical protein
VGVSIMLDGVPFPPRRVTVSLTGTTLRKALDFITTAAGLTYRVEPQGVVITSKNDAAPAPKTNP